LLRGNVKLWVLAIETREPVLKTSLFARLEGLVQDCRLNAVGPSTRKLRETQHLRSLVLMSCISERRAS
jgi:hypothetical protein